jgi:NAD(P)-dependent dehydrogenase (short-subunit alcohol dehydrogenase family)
MTAGCRRFENKVAVVAGGASGMGAATAQRLASEGARVVVGDINAEGAERVAAGIVDAGGEAVPVVFDLADEASVDALMQAAVGTFGGVDVLHANAADLSEATITGDTDAVSIDIDLFDSIIRTDLRGYLFCCRYAIPRMLERGGGAIVCTGSDGALLALNYRVAYCAAKAGVNSLVRHVAATWGKQGIRCNTVSPGPIQSETMVRWSQPAFLEATLARSPSQRLGEPADIAGCVAYLLSDDAAYVNGQLISVNGGLIMPH